MESIEIYKQLKKVYNTVNLWDSEILFVASLDTSDELTKCVVVGLPSFEHYIYGRSSISCYTDNQEDNLSIEFRDVRDLVNDLEDKSSIYRNAMLTEYRIINKKYREFLNYIFTLDINDFDYIYKLRIAVKQITMQYLNDTINPTPETIDINRYNNIYFTSDTHFGHFNILVYEQRTDRMGISSLDEHDSKLISNWNSVVGKNDLVYILGDFSFHKPDRTMQILKQLNGDKILIVGNHDCNYLKSKRFDKTLFKAIYDYTEINYNGQEICLMHYPIQEFKHRDRPMNPAIHLFGHIHSTPRNIPVHSFNVGVDVNNYTPVHIKEAIKQALSNSVAGNLNGIIGGD